MFEYYIRNWFHTKVLEYIGRLLSGAEQNSPVGLHRDVIITIQTWHGHVTVCKDNATITPNQGPLQRTEMLDHSIMISAREDHEGVLYEEIN